MDTIANMLTMIRNAEAVALPSISVPYTRFGYDVAKILEKKGLVEKAEKKTKKIKKNVKPKPCLEITLKYTNKIPAVSGFKKISKQGQRIYVPYVKIRKVKQGYGVAIISTSKGLMLAEDARRKKIGGEMLCEIW